MLRFKDFSETWWPYDDVEMTICLVDWKIIGGFLVFKRCKFWESFWDGVDDVTVKMVIRTVDLEIMDEYSNDGIF